MTINTNTLTAAIGDRVWLDANNNGIQDDGESGVSGVTVRLLDGIGRVLSTQQTDANGNYLFTKLGGGQYAIEVVKPGSYTFTTRDAGGNSNDVNDSDVDTSTGRSGIYQLASGQTNRTVDIGLTAPPAPATASLGDKVWLDTNGNGLQDSNESGVANFTVNLLNSAGSVISTRTTDANGKYLFTGLAAGQYSVEFVKGATQQFTTSNANSNGSDSDDSDANTITGRTGTYTLAAGEQNLTVDAGIKGTVTPTPGRDAATVCEDRSVAFNVLTNDTGTGLKLINVRHETAELDTSFKSQGRFGAISFTADGNVVYKTMDNYYGYDRLVYTVQDATGRTYDQFVDVTINPVSDAPEGSEGAQYHPGQWDHMYAFNNVTHYQHFYSFSDFGHLTDLADEVQTFGSLNVGTANDRDVRTAVVVYGLVGPTATYGRILYNGVELDFRDGKSYEIPIDDIKANKLVLDFTNQYVDYEIHYVNKDSGTIQNDCCYDGQVYTGTKKIIIVTPVALDLDGDGHIGVTGATSSYQKDADAALGHTVRFDIDGDGKKDTIEWFNGSGDGILIDNRDGLAAADMNGARLFGGQDGYGNGYYKMAALDADQDGKLSGAELKGLELWVDNGDAVVQKGEIQTLARHGIDAISTQLSLTYDAQGKLHIESTATRTDGSTLMSEDVFLAQADSSAPLPTLDTVLNFGNGALNKLLASFSGGESVSTAAHESVSASVQEHFSDNEMLRKLVEVFSAGQHAQVAMA
jgi:hypothetical protein